MTIVELFEGEDRIAFTVVKDSPYEAAERLRGLYDARDLGLRIETVDDHFELIRNKNDETYARLREFKPEWFVGLVMTDNEELTMLDELVDE